MLREQSANPDFWNDNQGASVILKRISQIEKEIDLWSDLARRHDDMEVLFEFADEGETGLDEELQVAEQRVFHNAQYPSHLNLPVIPRH